MSSKETVQKSEAEMQQELLRKKEPFKVEDLARELSVGTEVVKRIVDSLLEQGYTFHNYGEQIVRTKTENGKADIYDASKRFKGRHLKFGVISDTHLSSTQEKMDELNSAYDTLKAEGVRTVFHAGDFTDGYKVYRGQEFELKQIGQEAQIQYAIENYPQRDRVQTIGITGNHDLRPYELGGVDPLVQIARERPDIVYLGQSDAVLKLSEKIQMEILHPRGKTAYALSYRSQRDINNRTPETLPDVLVYGHYHTSFYMHYRNIHFLQAPCFKGEGRFEKENGLSPTIGFWIVEATLTDDLEKIQRFKPELFTFTGSRKQ